MQFVNYHNIVKHKSHQLQFLQIPTSVISSCSIISVKKLSRNQAAITSPTLSVEALRGRNFSYIRYLLLSAQCEMNAAAFKVIAESGFYNGSKISTAKKETPQLLGVFVLNMNTNCFIFNRDDPN